MLCLWYYILIIEYDMYSMVLDKDNAYIYRHWSTIISVSNLSSYHKFTYVVRLHSISISLDS